MFEDEVSGRSVDVSSLFIFLCFGNGTGQELDFRRLYRSPWANAGDGVRTERSRGLQIAEVYRPITLRSN